MGVFDSYYIPWALGSQEVQTKQYDSMMQSWTLGDRVSLESFEGAVPEHSFFVLEEEFSIGRWDSGNERHLKLAHWDGLFCDFIVGETSEVADLAVAQLQTLWAHAAWREEGLMRLFDNSRQDHDDAKGLAHAQRLLYQRLMSHHEQQELLKTDPARAKRMESVYSFHYDFKAKSLEQHWGEILARPAQRRGLETPWLTQAEVQKQVLDLQKAADTLKASEVQSQSFLMSQWGSAANQSRKRSKLHFNAEKQDALSAIRSAFHKARVDHVIDICKQVPESLKRSDVVDEITKWLQPMLCSRMFCLDAVSLMCETRIFPTLSFLEPLVSPQNHPLKGALRADAIVDPSPVASEQGESATTVTQTPLGVMSWLVSSLGVYAGAIEVMLQSGAPVETSLPFAMLSHSAYLDILPHALKGLDVKGLRSSEGKPILLSAIEQTHPATVQYLLSQGVRIDEVFEGKPLIVYAIEQTHHKRSISSESLNIEGFEGRDTHHHPNPLTREEIIVMLMIKAGAHLKTDYSPPIQSLLSETLQKEFAQWESQALLVNTALTSAPSFRQKAKKL